MQARHKEPDYLTQLSDIDREIDKLKAKREKVLGDKRKHDRVLLSEFMTRNCISIEDLQTIMTSDIPSEAVAAAKPSKTAQV